MQENKKDNIINNLKATVFAVAFYIGVARHKMKMCDIKCNEVF